MIHSAHAVGSTALATGRVERRLAAILAADVAGYSRLMGVDEEGTLARLKALRRELADPKIKEHRGRIVKTTGDGRLLELASVGILLHSPGLSRHARPLNRYLRHEAGLGGRVRELAILTTARELHSQFEWAAHEPEALSEGISGEIIEIIKHRKDTNGLDEADAVVIELGREIFGARKVASATFARSLQQFGRRALVDLVALMGNYAGTAALLTAFDMQLDPDQPPPLPPL